MLDADAEGAASEAEVEAALTVATAELGPEMGVGSLEAEVATVDEDEVEGEISEDVEFGEEGAGALDAEPEPELPLPVPVPTEAIAGPGNT